jgi:hypothetical protein
MLPQRSRSFDIERLRWVSRSHSLCCWSQPRSSRFRLSKRLNAGFVVRRRVKNYAGYIDEADAEALVPLTGDNMKCIDNSIGVDKIPFALVAND